MRFSMRWNQAERPLPGNLGGDAEQLVVAGSRHLSYKKYAYWVIRTKGLFMANNDSLFRCKIGTIHVLQHRCS